MQATERTSTKTLDQSLKVSTRLVNALAFLSVVAIGDIRPLMALAAILIMSFAFSIMVLVKDELKPSQYAEWHDAYHTVIEMISVGFYAYLDTSVFSHDRFPMILIMYAARSRLTSDLGAAHLWRRALFG